MHRFVSRTWIRTKRLQFRMYCAVHGGKRKKRLFFHSILPYHCMKFTWTNDFFEFVTPKRLFNRYQTCVHTLSTAAHEVTIITRRYTNKNYTQALDWFLNRLIVSFWIVWHFLLYFGYFPISLHTFHWIICVLSVFLLQWREHSPFRWFVYHRRLWKCFRSILFFVMVFCWEFTSVYWLQNSM